MNWTLYIFCLVGFGESLGHRILGIFPLHVKSHMIMYEQLMKGLARKGHQVDVVSIFPQKTPYPNYTDIVLPTLRPQPINNLTYEHSQKMRNNNVYITVAEIFGNFICRTALENSQLQEIIKNPPQDPPYDLVVTEILSAHCFIAFGHHLNIPVIGVTSLETYPWTNRVVANPQDIAFAPCSHLAYDVKMTFWQRVVNMFHFFYSLSIYDYYTSTQNELIKKHFGPNTPGVRELERTVSLVLVNSHPTFQGAKPTTPALIDVGGLHVQDDGPEIPTADKEWLDESTDGFVYFTFGSMVMIESLPKDTIKVLYKSLAGIAPVRVLMKIPHPELLPPRLPENIRTFSWMPQLKVLKHKNIRAFITHAGLMGLQEAITCAVPIIGIPLWADQYRNMKRAVERNIAIQLDHDNITEESFSNALDEILHNPTYREAAKNLSDKFLDRPLSALDTAIFWVEFVLKHGGESLRSPAMDLSWWQIALLDVYVVIFLFTVLAFIILTTFTRYIIRMLRKRQMKGTEYYSLKKKD